MVKEKNIILDLNENVINVIDFDSELEENSIIIQIKHTLIDTGEEMSCFSVLNQVNENPFYFGYISIGKVIAVGENVQYCREGMYVLLPATYEKFLIVSEQEKEQLGKAIFHVLPANLEADVIQSLFYPLLGVADALIEKLQEDGVEAVTLIGCHALGSILLKLCNINGITCNVVLGSRDVSTDFVEENGGMVLEFSEDLLENADKILVLEELQEKVDITQLDSQKYINVNQFLEDEYGDFVWNDRYIQSNIEEMLDYQEVDVSDMIGQHFHAESAQENYQNICENKYLGKLLVYDW